MYIEDVRLMTNSMGLGICMYLGVEVGITNSMGLGICMYLEVKLVLQIVWDWGYVIFVVER